jgi:hypothetical protein
MTFYNIIFGILFLAACRQVLVLSDVVYGWTAATIAVLVFNDAVNTSHVLERDTAPRYDIFMKLIDLCNFLVLSLALIGLKPGDNPFGVTQLPARLVNLLQPWFVWLLVSVYWVLAILWNWRAGLYQSNHWPCWIKVISHLLVIPFAAMTLVTAIQGTPDKVPLWLTIVVFACPALYFFVLKPIGQRDTASHNQCG